MNLPDGAPVAWFGSWHMGWAIVRPVRGVDLMLALLRDGAGWGAKHYLYGGSQRTIAALARRLPVLAPDADIVGAESPAFRPLTDTEFEALVDRIDRSEATVVWVATGTPRQDFLVHQLSRRVSAVCIAVGAAFDFVAGTKPQAPRILHGTGLEWLFRLATEPRRLWRRYLFGNMRFISAAVRDAWPPRRESR